MLTTEQKIEILEDWIENLLSGKFMQGTHTLRYTSIHGETFHCCLGVLAETQWDIPLESDASEGNVEVYDRIAETFGQDFSNECSQKNDKGFTFSEIVETTIRPYLEKMKSCLSN